MTSLSALLGFLIAPRNPPRSPEQIARHRLREGNHGEALCMTRSDLSAASRHRRAERAAIPTPLSHQISEERWPNWCRTAALSTHRGVENDQEGFFGARDPKAPGHFLMFGLTLRQIRLFYPSYIRVSTSWTGRMYDSFYEYIYCSEKTNGVRISTI